METLEQCQCYGLVSMVDTLAQPAYACSKLTVETLECEIWPDLTIKTLELRHVNLNIFYTLFWCFYC